MRGDAMKYFALIIALLALAACTPPAQLTKPVTVEVPKYIRVPIPAALVQDRIVTEPEPACQLTGVRVFCNGQIAQLLADYRAALAASNADKAALRELDSSPTAKPAAGTGAPVPAPAYYGDDSFFPTTARAASPWDMRGKRESRAARTRAVPRGAR
jgi:hypothetical protein